MTSRTWYHGVAALTLGVVLAGSTAGVSAEQSSVNAAANVQPLADGVQFGATYGEWSARWWQWVLSFPSERNPNFDATGASCAEGQTGTTWFLAGLFDQVFPGNRVTRTCTIPAGRAIFFPVLNNLGFAAFPNEGVPVLRAQAAGFIDGATLLRVTLDGVDLRGLQDLRVQSPAFAFVVPVDGIVSQGTCSPLFVPNFIPPVPPERQGQLCDPAVSDGFWVLLAPLRPGEHTLRFRARSGDFSLDVTYKLTILA